MAKHDSDAEALASASATAMFADDKASQALGIEITDVHPGAAVAHMSVTESMVNGHDICHGGYLFTLADTAFAFACNTYGRVTVAAGASIEFLQPVKLGDRLCARATEVHRGPRSGIYDVRVWSLGADDDERLVALFRGRSATLKQAIDTN